MSSISGDSLELEGRAMTPSHFILHMRLPQEVLGLSFYGGNELYDRACLHDEGSPTISSPSTTDAEAGAIMLMMSGEARHDDQTGQGG